MKKLLFCTIFLIFTTLAQSQTTWQVGPSRTYTAPSQVINQISDGDIVEIDAGEYLGDVGAWYANNITIRGVGGMAHIRANGNYSQGKAIWVIAGDNYVIENIELSECTVPDENGAGIRQEGTNLTVRSCYFHDNENGILAGNNANSEILIEYSEFARNSHFSGYAHNIYINRVQKFTLRHSYFHGAVGGHNLKSRAAENHILYNRIMDESTGSSSYVIDIPDAGKAYVVGNVLQQGPNAENSTVISYGRENPNTYSLNEFNFYNNTLVNERGNGYFFGFSDNTAPNEVRVFNNLFAGAVAQVSFGLPPIDMNKNLYYPTISDAGLMDYTNYDYQLTNSSLAIDAGLVPSSQGAELPVEFQYVHPMLEEARPADASIDMGAYEFGMTTTLATQQLVFSATSIADKVQLQWTTNFGKNIKYIEVEKATQNQAFETITHLSNPSKKNNKMEDRNIQAGEIYYYRLKIAFEDGQIQYADIQTVKVSEKQNLALFPNPAEEVLYVNWANADSGTIRLLNAQGMLIQTFQVKNKTHETLDISDLAKGLYYLEWEGKGQKMVSKIMVQ